MTEDLPEILKPETKEHYEADAAKYWKNIESAKHSGVSADDLAVADGHLPSPRLRAAHADRLAKGFDKTSRSGARVDSSNAVPAIFPGGLKSASDFIDEMTPGKYKPQEEMKPPKEQKRPTGFFPKPAVVLDRCLDCMEPMGSHQQYVLGMTVVLEEDSQKLFAMGVKHGDLIVYNICCPCFDKAKELTRDNTPLVLVFGGALTDENDIRIAQKYNFPVNLHSGSEKTRGQWNMIKRAERVMDQLWDYLMQENLKPNSPIFRNREKVQ
jgi:hypothetical protein